ncbi:MAG: DUF2325 domain-containing protein [Hyphomicrobiaceae bacterium]
MPRPRISLAEGLASHLATRGKPAARPSSPSTAAKGRRLRIWEVRGNIQCSIVGTCLSHGDLVEISRKCGLTLDPDITDYSLHGYFSGSIATDNSVSRAVQKRLDRRHEGIIRRFSRAATAQDLTALWAEEFGAGRISGAYWALVTCDHVPQELHTRAFGEVHMLSHVLGRTAHAGAARASELDSRVADLEARLARTADHHAAALARRDARIAELERQLTERAVCPIGHQGRTAPLSSRSPQRTDQRERALAIARARARLAEADVTRLRQDLARARRRLATAPAPAGECPGAVACRLALPRGDRLRVLYLGGRNGSVEQLRAVAEQAGAELLHHDGGIEHAPARVEELVQRCHVVFCPVDCVSHEASLRAKQACQKRQRHFVPLRSAGASTFARAMSGLDIVKMDA